MGEFVGMQLAEARGLAGAFDSVAAEVARRAGTLARLTADLDGGATAGRMSAMGDWAAGQARDIRWRADELEAIDTHHDGYAHATFPWKTFGDFQEDFQLGQAGGRQLTQDLEGQKNGYVSDAHLDEIVDLHKRGRAYIEGFFETMRAGDAARLRAAIREDPKLAKSFDTALASYLQNPSHSASYNDFGAKRDTAIAKAVANDLATELRDPKHMRPSWSEVQRLLGYLHSIKDNPDAAAAFFNGLGGKKSALLPLFVINGWAGQTGKHDIQEVERAIDLIRSDLATASQTVGHPAGLQPGVVNALLSAKLPGAGAFKRPPDEHTTAEDVNKALTAAGFSESFIDVAAKALGSHGLTGTVDVLGKVIVLAQGVDALAIGVEKGFDSPEFFAAGVEAGLDVAAFAVDGPIGALVVGLSLFVSLLSTIGPCHDCPEPAMEYGTDARPPGDPHYINSAGFAPDPQHVSS